MCCPIGMGGLQGGHGMRLTYHWKPPSCGRNSPLRKARDSASWWTVCSCDQFGGGCHWAGLVRVRGCRLVGAGARQARCRGNRLSGRDRRAYLPLPPPFGDGDDPDGPSHARAVRPLAGSGVLGEVGSPFRQAFQGAPPQARDRCARGWCLDCRNPFWSEAGRNPRP